MRNIGLKASESGFLGMFGIIFKINGMPYIKNKS